jgi:hypothetical protein
MEDDNKWMVVNYKLSMVKKKTLRKISLPFPKGNGWRFKS